MTITLYILRHGQTAYSETGGYCGTPANDPGLTPAGIEMAKVFAQVYANLPWTGILVSPLRRTIETAQPICDQTGITMQLKPELQEIAYGQWEGLQPRVVNYKFHDQYVRWLTDPAWNAPPGGEKAVDIALRVWKLIQEIEQTYVDGNILLVSHKATIRILLCVLLGIDVGRYRDRFDMPVNALSIVELGHHGPFFRIIGDRSHLPESLRSLPST
ncbi:histidine phosphatase family protein [Floridanema evergladense]|uniref:Histidine phosphatase family protein n=1 Tax=Floridaenema evergladense BLCC-F167 TaxID=3153639 RepID=A0ABV4WH67_9CYAN